MTDNKNSSVGSSFDDFLKEEGIHDEVTAESIKRASVDIDELTAMLKEDITIVQFTKVNGDKRVMVATLNEKYMDEVPEKKTEQTRKTSDDIIRVWDVANKGWRSFRKDSVAYYERKIDHKLF